MHAAHASFSLREYMARSHAYLRNLFARLLTAMEHDAPDVRALWAELDAGLMTHMEAEERYVIPAFAREDLVAARSLLVDHAAFRDQLLELGVAVDLHCFRYPRARELTDLLDAHATREDELLYRWAERALHPSIIQTIRDHLAAGT